MNTTNIKELFGPEKLSGLSRHGSKITTPTLNRMHRGDGFLWKHFSLATESESESES